MASEILEFRLSLIWAETILDLLGKTVPAGAPLAALGRRSTYENFFEQHALPLATKTLSELGPPWPKPKGQLYWQRYLESSALDELSGSVAWRALVPLRADFPVTVTPGAWLAKVPVAVQINIIPEAFFYPHGSVFVLTAIVNVESETAALKLYDAVDLAFKIRRDKFNVSWDGSTGFFAAVNWAGGPSEMTLDQLAEKALAAIRLSAFGPGNPGPVIDPFTILTAIRGRGISPVKPVDATVRRALEAVTRWSPSWLHDPLPNLQDRKIDIKTSPASHVLYGRPKGRAVWFPERLTHPDNPPSLACYHRNLTFSSMQIESLCGLAAAAAAQLSGNQLDSEAMRDCTRQAGGALGRLFGGGGVHKKSYRSMSPRVQIEQNGFVADINTVRKALGVGNDLS